MSDSKFWRQVEKTDTCWIWRGHVNNGYGRYHYRKDGRRKTVYAHRFAYQALRGEVPAGLVLDHLCRNRACVNPDHLDPVTDAENFRRGAGTGGVLYEAPTVCHRGHGMTEAGDVYVTAGQRYCRECARHRYSAYEARKYGLPAPGLVIREWGRRNGFECASTGPLPKRLVSAFADAHDREPGELPEVEK